MIKLRGTSFEGKVTRDEVRVCSSDFTSRPSTQVPAPVFPRRTGFSREWFELASYEGKVASNEVRGARCEFVAAILYRVLKPKILAPMFSPVGVKLVSRV